MRGASVVRRRSATNPGDTAGSVNGGQADGGGSELLAGGDAADSSAVAPPDSAREDVRGAAQAEASSSPADPSAAPVQAGAAAPGGPRSARGRSRAGRPGLGPRGRPRAVPAAAARADNRPLGHPAGRPRPPRRPGPAPSRFALANWRVRWRLAAVIALPTLIAAALGSFLIYGDVNTWAANGRTQHLAQLNASVVKLTQALEDERDLFGRVRGQPERPVPHR